MTWDNFWSYFTNSSNEIKAYLWQQIDLEKFLKGLAPKYQIEVMKNAPADVINLVKTCLYPDTQIKLEKKTHSARLITLELK